MDIETRETSLNREIDDYLTKDRPESEDFNLDEKPADPKRKRLAAAGAILLILLTAGYLSWSSGHASFAKEKVKVSIEMPSAIGSGEETSITLNCTNENKVDLGNAKLAIAFPEGFIMESSDKNIIADGSYYVWNLQDLAAGSTEKARVYGKMIGLLDDKKEVRATLSFKPQNFNSEFRVEGSALAGITSVPIDLSLAFPEFIRDASESELSFDYRNKTDRDFGKIRLEIEFPKNFVYASSAPGMTRQDGDANIWVLEEDSFAKGASKNARIKGSFQSQNEKETVEARIYLMEINNEMTEYAKTSKDIRMEKTEIALTQTVNGQPYYDASKNEELTYRIGFKNQSSQELRGLVIKDSLDGNYDLATLSAPGATIDGRNLLWSALNVPELASLPAGAEGTVEFKVRVKDRFDITKEADKNFILKSAAQISSFNSQDGSDSTERVIAKNEAASKVKAFLFLDAKGYFNDDGRLPNSGSIPPRVGQMTSYTIHWTLRNFFNPTKNIRVAVTLGTGVRWSGRYINSEAAVIDASGADVAPSAATAADGTVADYTSERLYFDKAANQVVWEIPALKANAGVLSAAKEVVFQVEAVPSTVDTGKPMLLTDTVSAKGYDAFTGSDTNNGGAMLTTDLTAYDFSISPEQALVQL